jgi:hypothetical protein
LQGFELLDAVAGTPTSSASSSFVVRDEVPSVRDQPVRHFSGAQQLDALSSKNGRTPASSPASSTAGHGRSPESRAQVNDAILARCMLICMHSTSVRIDVGTHEELKRLAAALDTTVGNTVALAVRALRQDHIGHQLHSELRNDETAWLDAELG